MDSGELRSKFPCLKYLSNQSDTFKRSFGFTVKLGAREPPMNLHDKADSLWQSSLVKLPDSISSEELDTWIRPLQPELHGETLTLYAPNPFVFERVSELFKPQIEQALPEGTSLRLTVGTRPKQGAPAKTAGGSAIASSNAQSDKRTSDAPRPGRKPPQTVAREPGYLPAIWSDVYRAIPNVLVRTALCTINRYGLDTPRPHRNKTLIASQKNISMYVTGEETNQFDADVLMQLTHYQRNLPVGTLFSFSARQVLEDLGKPLNGRNHAELIASIHRLAKTYVELEQNDGDGPRFVSFNLVAQFARDDSESAPTQSWQVSFPSIVLELFAKDSYTRLVWEQSQMLDSSLAKFLHRYFASHREPFPLTTAFLHDITGSNLTELRKFRANMKKALDELVSARFLLSWSYDSETDKFTVQRNHEPFYLESSGDQAGQIGSDR